MFIIYSDGKTSFTDCAPREGMIYLLVSPVDTGKRVVHKDIQTPGSGLKKGVRCLNTYSLWRATSQWKYCNKVIIIFSLFKVKVSTPDFLCKVLASDCVNRLIKGNN